MNRNIGILIGMVVVLAGIGLLAPAIFEDDHAAQTTSEFEGDFETFDSKAAFEKYVAQSEQRRDTTSLPGGEPSVRVTADRAVAETTDSSQQRAEGDAAGGGPETTFETRQTNVQEVGVGEPDIVKVTDEYTYYSQKPTYIRTDPRLSEDTASQPREPRSTTGGLRTIRNPNAPQRYITSTDELKITNTSHTTGQLLRTDTRLVVYNDSLVTGYDIRRDEKSKQWELPLNDSTSVMTTRRIDDIAYFVVRDRSATCPVQPVETHTVIECTDIHRPSSPATNSETVYTTIAVDLSDGTIEDEMTFLGSDAQSAIYMSDESLYVSYETTSFGIDEMINVVLENDEFEAGSDTEAELEQLLEYDLSPQAKRVEFENIIEGVNNSREVRQNISTNIESYLDANKRDLFRSQIVKITANDGELSQVAMGSVPGVPLNQFAFDEQDGELRLATTVMEDDNDLSENDLYVLNGELEITGSVQGMAAGQRVYAVRFIEDRGYVITYRQVDPLHVIDLSESSSPEEIGTLKLPGFSEYLHPVGDGLLLGIGESQDGNGKVVLFDVKDGSTPRVADSLVLENTYSTAVSESHHAFMNDPAQQTAYIPAGDSLYVTDYSQESLDQEVIIPAGQSAKRTRLYTDQVVVFSETRLTALNRTSHDVKTGISLLQ